MVAFHYPPQVGSSGRLRALKFSQYLLHCGWEATVLSAWSCAYPEVSQAELPLIPKEVQVLRAFALDSQRHLSIRGRYLSVSALPDRWVTWCLDAIPRALLLMSRQRIDVIFSTYPIATAMMIGYVLHRLTGKPWIADFRDPMTEDHYPFDPMVWRARRWIESKVAAHARRLVFTTPSARRMYLERYSSLRPEKCVVIPNGYDEEDFKDLPIRTPQRTTGSPLRLVHGGLIYPIERDPVPFFRALARLKRERHIAASNLQIGLRGSGNETQYASTIRELQIEDIVHLLAPLSYQQLLREEAEADATLLFQARNCNQQIPAKLYECLRLGRPILALADCAGDTAAVLRETGGATVIDLADEQAIYRDLPAFLESLRSGTHAAPDPGVASRYSRQSQAYELASILNAVVRESVLEAGLSTGY